MTPPMGTRRRPAPAQQQQQATHEPPTGRNSSVNTASTMARPPPIQTRGPSFSSSAAAVSGASQRNEVVIDGESSATDSEEEEDVMVITPQSRKRKRMSAIMDEDDEEEEAKQEDGGSSARTTPPANKRLYLSPNLRSATSTTRPSIARAGGGNSSDEDIDVDVDDDDNEVEIVQVGSAAKPLDGSASKKNRRLTIEDSDDENDQAASQDRIAALSSSKFENTPSRRRSSIGADSGTTPGSNTSSSRRSSRIERKRQEKESGSSSVRKLNYLSLDNCLDPIEKPMKKNGKARAADGTDEDGDEEDDNDDFEEEEEETIAPAKPRRRPTREIEREVLHADGDDDLDEFIVGDNEIEYMDDDENGVISVESGSEDDDDIEEYNEADEFAAHHAAQQTRERDEWFAIYMEYIEESIIDADLDNKMRRRQGSPQYQLYREAIFHIERELCSRRDNLRGNVVWPEDMLSALKSASSFRSSHCDADYECEACNRTNHMATYVAQLGGVACDASELYRENWMQRLRKNMLQAKAVNATFQMGSVCHARTLAYWQLLHAKRFWCILVDAKRKECSDATGRIAAQFRAQFNKQEFGRYKRLLTLVETFETEARQSYGAMTNVWKKITPQQYKSAFLPRHKGNVGQQQQQGASRRGTMDSFVAESEEEDEDQEVEHVEENEVVDADDDDDEESDAEQKDNSVHMGGPGRRAQEDKSSTSKITAFFTPTATSTSNKSETTSLKSEHESSNNSNNAMKSEGTEAEDLLCLVCGENPRNGGIMHGQYLHFYCCFRCGKRQFRSKMGCLVCDRPIDKVLRLLPLTAETRKAIKEHK